MKTVRIFVSDNSALILLAITVAAMFVAACAIGQPFEKSVL